MNSAMDHFKDNATRNYSDFLVAYATLPGHVAFRNNITGSWFIQIFCEVFMNYAYKYHLYDLLTLVSIKYLNNYIYIHIYVI